MRLTSEQRKAIRDMAKRIAGVGNVTLELGIRYDKESDWEGYNLDDEPNDDTTDLFGTEAWADIVKDDFPEDMTLDFYVYSTGPLGELKTNLLTRFRGGRLVSMYQNGTLPSDLLWTGEI